MSAARSRRANDKHNHLQRTPIKDMGRVMGALTQRTGGNFDKAAAAATLNQRLS